MNTYGKWDSPEDDEVAFEAVRSGEWTLARFKEWVTQVELDEYRRNWMLVKLCSLQHISPRR